MIRLGQYPPADLLLAHLSDLHVRADAELLGGRIDTLGNLEHALARIEGAGLRPDALVFTGDVADTGEDDAYRRVAALVEPAAERLGSRVVWAMGNHDEPTAFRRRLLGLDDRTESVDTEPIDAVHRFDGLRVVVLDTTVRGYHHGALTEGQLERLSELLEEPSPRGTILAMHHPPIPTPLAAMTILELQDQDRLATVLSGSDVRAILAGHLHYGTTGTFAGIPVSVAPATSYTMDLAAPVRELHGVDGGQSFSLVRVHEHAVVTASVPIGGFEVVTRFDEDFTDRMERLDHSGRIEAFSRIPEP